MPSSGDGGAPAILTLMCLDRPVTRFCYDAGARRVIWRDVIDIARCPLGSLDSAGTMTRPGLAGWISRRAVPMTRPGVEGALREMGVGSPEELVVSTHGASLSDQFWFRPEGSSLTWDDVSFFDNDFPDELGTALAGPSDSSEGAVARLARDGVVALSSPDAALDGNLPKRWVIREDGTRVLLKSGKPGNLFQEPLNEVAATGVCELILEDGDFVPYELADNDAALPRHLSACPCMVDSRTQLVSAGDVVRSRRRDPCVSLYEAFVSACEANGIGRARAAVSKMLVLDHLIANWDRHWGNFGVLVDSESGRWLRVAPVFDTGESLWCDRALSGRIDGSYRRQWPMPFSHDIDGQLERYVDDLTWLDPDALASCAPVVERAITTPQLVTYNPAWVDAVCSEVDGRARDVRELWARLAGRSRFPGAAELIEQASAPRARRCLRGRQGYETTRLRHLGRQDIHYRE